MKHKSLLSVFIIAIVLTLTSCIDYVQSITYSNGKYHLYHKITLSKLLLELADEDAEDFVEELLEDSSDEIPDYVSMKGVNTETEVGFEFMMDINPKTATEEEKEFLPTKSSSKYYIPFYISEIISDSDDFDDVDLDDSFTLAMFSAYFVAEDEDDENYYISVFDYGNNYCLEISFLLFVDNYLYDLDRIVITRAE